MTGARWRKLGRDLLMEKGRVLLMITAIAVSLVAVGSMLGAYSILTREIAVNYLGTRPASATLEMEDARAVVEEVRRDPAIAEAEAREVVFARARVGEDWRPLLLFVIDDFTDLRLNLFRPESGAWPPPEGSMLIERTAVSMLEAGPGRGVLVKTPNGSPKEVPITGLVHDPGLAPAWQERLGYGYVTRGTLGLLGEAPLLGELRIFLADRPYDLRAIEETAARLAKELGERGASVREIRVPPPAMHPHQRQMTTVLFMMLAFSAMALVLSAILVSTSLAAMLARQVREIGVMKTIGARADQIAGMYAVLIAAMGTVAALLATPIAIMGARLFAAQVSNMLNFTLTSTALPPWVFAVHAAAGVLVPLSVAMIPIRRASKLTVRQAIDQHGVSGASLRPWLSSLPYALRNALRRPVRLSLTLGLLAAGGAMFMTALNVKQSWVVNLKRIDETRFYDLEIRLHEAQPGMAEALARVPGVRRVEPWGHSSSALAQPDRIDVVRTYPDRGHGSLAILAPPPDTALIRFPLRSGRWLEPGDEEGVVLNHSVLAQSPKTRVGDPILLSIDGRPHRWRVVGVVEEIGSAGAAYVTDRAFARRTGSREQRMLRIATSARSKEERALIIRAIERELAEKEAKVEAVIPLSELRTAVGDHMTILIRTLIAMAMIMATVGTLGLGSTMGINVLERVREIGVMKAIGATPAHVMRMIVTEALFVGAMSWILALALSVPLTALVDWLVGNLGFLAPLPLVFEPEAMLGWLLLVGIVSIAATLVPARRASLLTVREAIAHS